MKRQQLRKIIIPLLFILAVVAACETAPPATDDAPPPDGEELLQTAVDNIRTVDSFEMIVEQRGVPFLFVATLGAQGDVTGTLERAEAQYVAPDVMYANARIRILGAPVGLQLFARNTDQWLDILGSGWQQFIVADGFNAADLVREGSGFDKALSELRELEYIQQERLIDGTLAHHVRGLANGQIIYDLLFGLLEFDSDNVTVDVYINVENNMPVQLEVNLAGTATEEIPEDTLWYIELFDFDADPMFEAPDDLPLGEDGDA